MLARERSTRTLRAKARTFIKRKKQFVQFSGILSATPRYYRYRASRVQIHVLQFQLQVTVETRDIQNLISSLVYSANLLGNRWQKLTAAVKALEFRYVHFL